MKEDKLMEILSELKPPIDGMVNMDRDNCLWCGTPLTHEKWNNRIKELRLAILQLFDEMLPSEKPVRYENCERYMGKDGVINVTRQNIRYNKEEEAYNQCLADIKARIKEMK